MTKRQMIDEILTVNKTAAPAFLARFDETELTRYLQHLNVLKTPRLFGDPHRFDKYFVSDASPRRAAKTSNSLKRNPCVAMIPEALANARWPSRSSRTISCAAGVTASGQSRLRDSSKSRAVKRRFAPMADLTANS